MKRSSLSVLALGATLITAGYLAGQNSKAPAPTAPAPQQQKLVHVATLPTVEANREFQENVQKMQLQRQAVAELKAKADAEKDAKKKKDLTAEFNKAMALLEENNAKMLKAYGFSLTRNYTLEIERAHVYMQVSPEEAAKIEQEQKKKK